MSTDTELIWSSGEELEEELGREQRLLQPYHSESSIQVLARLTPEGDTPGTAMYPFRDTTPDDSAHPFSFPSWSSWSTDDDQYDASQSEGGDTESSDLFDEMLESEWVIDQSRSDEQIVGDEIDLEFPAVMEDQDPADENTEGMDTYDENVAPSVYPELDIEMTSDRDFEPLVSGAEEGSDVHFPVKTKAQGIGGIGIRNGSQQCFSSATSGNVSATQYKQAPEGEPKPKKRRKNDGESPDVTDDEQRKRQRSEAARGSRSKYLNEVERMQVLEDDPDVLSYDECSVVCRGCRKKRNLQKGRKYELKNWIAHKDKCPGLTGVRQTRSSKISTSKTESVQEDALRESKNGFGQWGFVATSSTTVNSSRCGVSPATPTLLADTTASDPSDVHVPCRSLAQNAGNAQAVKQASKPFVQHSKGLKAGSGARKLKSQISDYFSLATGNTRTGVLPQSAHAQKTSSSAPAQSPQAPPPPPPLSEPKPCQGLHGGNYEEYVLRTDTRSLGGVSTMKLGQIARELFPYKPLLPLKFGPQKKLALNDSDDDGEVGDVVQGEDEQFTALNEDRDDSEDQELDAETARAIKHEVPDDGNRAVGQSSWTRNELRKFDIRLRALARWEVNYDERTVRSSTCRRQTTNESEICKDCLYVAKDPSLKDAVQRKFLESKLPEKKQHDIFKKRLKFSPGVMRGFDNRALETKLQDPLLCGLFHDLQRANYTGSFLRLHKAAVAGKITQFKMVIDICTVFADHFARSTSGNAKAKHGIRYPPNYLNWMLLLRGYGGDSARQYALLSGQIPAPSARHLRRLVANTEDALQNPALIYENVVRVKRLLDALFDRYPFSFIFIGIDCTKVRARLSYSNAFGSHILGSTLALDETIVNCVDDIEKVIEKITAAGAVATQVRALVVKFPWPGGPVLPLALLPGNGKDDAADIHQLQLDILKMSAQAKLRVAVMAADGAASELAAQTLLDNVKTDCPSIRYNNETYGLHIKVVVHPTTGPCVSVSDILHAMKTARNQPQHGTHTASMGNFYFNNNSLVDIFLTGVSGLMRSDVINVDKQDDGAARRLFHHAVLNAMVHKDGDEEVVREEFKGIFSWLFIIAELGNAWLNRSMDVRSRLIAVLRARFFLHIWRSFILRMADIYPDLYSTSRSFISSPSFNIFNRLCDSLLGLVLIYTECYPDAPFCPWLVGTEFVEHFFGIARHLIPNFTFTQFISVAKHVMLRQRLLLSGEFPTKDERRGRCGYQFDFDTSPMGPEELASARIHITRAEIDAVVVLAHMEATKIADWLHMPSSPLPFQLAPLSGPPRTSKQRSAPSSDEQQAGTSGEGPSSDADSDVSDELGEGTEDEECAGDARSTLSDVGVNSEALDGLSLAAGDAARDSALTEAASQIGRSAQSLQATEKVSELSPSGKTRRTTDTHDANSPSKITQPSAPILPSSDPNPSRTSSSQFSSTILDTDGSLSISRLLRTRKNNEAPARVKTHRTTLLDPKFEEIVASTDKSLRDESNAAERRTAPDKHKAPWILEASHRVRIAQDSDPRTAKAKTSRQLQWEQTVPRVQLLFKQSLANLAVKNIHEGHPLVRGSFVVIRNKTRFGRRLYIAEVLDIYRQGTSGGRHCSIDGAESGKGLSNLSVRVFLPLTKDQGLTPPVKGKPKPPQSRFQDSVNTPAPVFSSQDPDLGIELYTHAKAADMLYHLGPSMKRVFGGERRRRVMELMSGAALKWQVFSSQKFTELMTEEGSKLR